MLRTLRSLSCCARTWVNEVRAWKGSETPRVGLGVTRACASWRMSRPRPMTRSVKKHAMVLSIKPLTVAGTVGPTYGDSEIRGRCAPTYKHSELCHLLLQPPAYWAERS